MKKKFKEILIALCIAVLPVVSFAQPDLTGMASVNVTSDTASNAKIMAFNEARRQIVQEVLSKYSESSELIKNADDATLTNLISSTGLDSERVSATTYSANIKMTIDANQAKKWLDENDAKNWLESDDNISVEKIVVQFEIANGMRDWIDLNRAFYAGKINITVKEINGYTVIANMPVTERPMLIDSVKVMGWKYSGSNPIKIWK